MIIECINCNKKFEVNSELIPNEGRSIQCGACDHIWFFDKNNKNQNVSSKDELVKKTKFSDLQDKIQNKDDELLDQEISEKEIDIKERKNLNQKKQKKVKFTFGNFLSYIIVSIVTFVAIILIIDTFKSPLYNSFPKLETILYNLFETLEDIRLFIKDLI